MEAAQEHDESSMPNGKQGCSSVKGRCDTGEATPSRIFGDRNMHHEGRVGRKSKHPQSTVWYRLLNYLGNIHLLPSSKFT